MNACLTPCVLRTTAAAASSLLPREGFDGRRVSASVSASSLRLQTDDGKTTNSDIKMI